MRVYFLYRSGYRVAQRVEENEVGAQEREKQKVLVLNNTECQLQATSHVSGTVCIVGSCVQSRVGNCSTFMDRNIRAEEMKQRIGRDNLGAMHHCAGNEEE